MLSTNTTKISILVHYIAIWIVVYNLVCFGGGELNTI